MKKWNVLLVAFCFIQVCNAQFHEETIRLPKELQEISGIAALNDSVLAAINDSGNEACLYFLNLKGHIIHKSIIHGATNIDWEDLTIHDSVLYIADVGNNLSDRKDLCVYKVDVRKGWRKDTLQSDKIEFSYMEQTGFPPAKGSVKFDCEAIYFSDNKLHLLAKTMEEPWLGTARIYSLPIEKGKYSIQSIKAIHVPSKNWREGAATSCCINDSLLTVLMYNRIIDFDKKNLISQNSMYKFGNLKQREGICQLSDGQYIVVSERHPVLGGPFLTVLKREE